MLVLTLTTMLALAAPAAEQARCVAIDVALQQIHTDPGAVGRIIALLPGPLSERAATEAGRTDHAGVVAIVVRAAALACPGAESGISPGIAPGGDLNSAALRSWLTSDPRFGGLRADASLGDRVLERVWRFLEKLLESESMQRFSEHTRTIYLSLLGAFGGLLAFRLWRRKGRSIAGSASGDVVVGVERQRRQAFERCRQDALDAIEHDPRAALLHLRRALLVRIGELDEGALSPARTSSELLASLATDVALVVQPALLSFDGAFYGGRPDQAGARTLLVAVDAAHEALKLARPARPAKPSRSAP